jgi:hypothetical protein
MQLRLLSLFKSLPCIGALPFFTSISFLLATCCLGFSFFNQLRSWTQHTQHWQCTFGACLGSEDIWGQLDFIQFCALLYPGWLIGREILLDNWRFVVRATLWWNPKFKKVMAHTIYSPEGDQPLQYSLFLFDHLCKCAPRWVNGKESPPWQLKVLARATFWWDLRLRNSQPGLSIAPKVTQSCGIPGSQAQQMV